MTSSREERGAFFRDAGRHTPYVAVESGEELFFVATEDVGVGHDLFARRNRVDLRVLPEALELLQGSGVALPPQPVFVDVGANIGTTTVAALRRHGFASAVAVEPSPDNVRTLRLNLVANDVDGRATVICAAASETERELALELSPGTSGEHQVVADALGDAVTVPAVTLDALVARAVFDLDRVGMLWIDAQGHEAAVLRGAGLLLDRLVPVVCAVRRERGWDDVSSSLPGLVAGYHEVVRLRKDGRRRPIAELPEVLGEIKGGADLLFVPDG